MPFVPAQRERKKARIVIDGAAGSGKTLTALYLAQGLCAPGKQIAVIDTENGRSLLHAGKVPFLVDILADTHPERYIDRMQEAGDLPEVDVLVIDSISHAWAGPSGILALVDQVRGNKFANGWGDVGTPLWNRLVNMFLYHPKHVIVTIRSKMTYAQETGENGRAQIVRLGISPVVRDGFEYEADWILRASLGTDGQGGVISITKTPTEDIAGTFVRPGADLGATIRTFLESGGRARADIVNDLRVAYRIGRERQIVLPSPESLRDEIDVLTNAQLEQRLAALRAILDGITSDDLVLVP